MIKNNGIDVIWKSGKKQEIGLYSSLIFNVKHSVHYFVDFDSNG